MPAHVPPRAHVGDWAKQGACLTAGVDMFPDDGHGVALARAVCARCPVADECLQHALANHEDEGVWGGKSQRERKAMRRSGLGPTRRHRVAPCGSDSGYYRHLRTVGDDPCGPCKAAHSTAELIRQHGHQAAPVELPGFIDIEWLRAWGHRVYPLAAGELSLGPTIYTMGPYMPRTRDWVAA